jgi:hypothetical protein
MKFPSSTLLLLVATCHDVAVQSFTISSFLPGRIINGGRATSAEPSSSSSYGDSLLKASEKESGENFQRRLLATRLNRNIRDNTKLRSGGSDSDGGNNTASPVLLEDADGLGVALLDKNNIQDDVVIEETQQPLLKKEEEEVVESVSVKDVVLLMEEVEEVSNKDVVLLNGTVADEDYINELMMNIEVESEKITQELIEEACEVDDETGGSMDSLCEDEEEMKGFRASFKRTVGKTIQVVRGVPECEDENLDPEPLCVENEESMGFRSKLKNIFRRTPKEKVDDDGDSLEAGWSDRGNSSSIRRNAEIWKFGLKCIFRVLKPRSMRTKGASDEEVEQAQIEAATYIRDGLLTLGPVR